MKFIKYLLTSLSFLLFSFCNQNADEESVNMLVKEKEFNIEEDGGELARLSCEIGELKFKRIHMQITTQEYSNIHNDLNKQLSQLHKVIKKRYNTKELEILGDIWEREVNKCESKLEIKYKKIDK